MNTLAGKHILITRAAEQNRSLAKLIEQRGGIAVGFPCLAMQCLPDHINKAVAKASANTTFLFSSANGVNCAASALGDDFIPLMRRHAVVVVGAQTETVLAEHGIRAAWVADEASQEGLIRGFLSHGLPANICFLRAEEGRDVLQEALQAQGVGIELVHAYRTICPDDDSAQIRHALQQGDIDAVLLGSSRTAQHYVQRIGDARLADRPAVAVISAQVADAARQTGLSVQTVAKEASFAAMLDALEDFFAANDTTGEHPAANRSAVEEHRP